MATAMMSAKSAALLLHEVKSATAQGEVSCIHETNFGKMARTVFDAIRVLCETVIARENEVNALRAENARIATQRDAALAERDEARAILEGSTEPPTDAEILAHANAGGSWLTDYRGRGFERVSDPDILRFEAHGQRDAGDTTSRWWAIDARRRFCPRPKVPA